mgnify:FL=1
MKQNYTTKLKTIRAEMNHNYKVFYIQIYNQNRITKNRHKHTSTFKTKPNTTQGKQLDDGMYLH